MKIGVIENDPALNATLIDYVEMGLGYSIEVSAESVAELKQSIGSISPDLILLDINLNDTRGLDTVKAVRGLLPKTDIIVITGDNKQKFVMDCIELGVGGFLYKPFNLDRLREAIEHVCNNGKYLDPASLTELVNTLQSPALGNEQEITKMLTEKEIEVFNQLKTGKSCKQIADSLHVSNNTVNFHLKNIYNKAEVHSRSELMSRILPGKN